MCKRDTSSGALDCVKIVTGCEPSFAQLKSPFPQVLSHGLGFLWSNMDNFCLTGRRED